MGELLDVCGVAKTYGATRALRGIDLRLGGGEVVSVLGENGAGKSTLIKILSGVVTPDDGTITIMGHRVRFTKPRDSLDAGIAYIPQELSAVGSLTVAENLVLGSWPSRAGVTTKRSITTKAREICERTGMPLPLTRPASTLWLSELQELEIAKALARNARIILLDEPTAALSEAEAQHLFELVRGLTERGVGILFVSHRLDEVAAISDRVVVLRNGARVADVPGETTTREELIQYMVGDVVSLPERIHSAELGDTVLDVRDLCTESRPALRDVSFSVRSSEVVGIYGIRGSGASVVAECLGGEIRRATGSLAVDGAPTRLPPTPRAAQRAGITYIPPDRKRGGLFPNFSIAANLSTVDLDNNSNAGILRLRHERSASKAALKDLRVAVRSERQNVMTLSGGNQQKVLVAGRIRSTEHVLVANEPTRGVDVGARRSIHNMIRALAADGRSALVISSDVDEIVSACDRVFVMCDGALVGELAGQELTEANVIATAAGARPASSPEPTRAQTSPSSMQG